ncbi:unnamed protein product [Allacma fusca]|uniref:Uncharacterized protein n=1 Tax=Allacma fusca TaxID=39272 RepID=A0A8J2J7K7_9HEXA|nr:unnamed protein product [Allacma fusca]
MRCDDDGVLSCPWDRHASVVLKQRSIFTHTISDLTLRIDSFQLFFYHRVEFKNKTEKFTEIEFINIS